ncbi:MAG: phosphoribosylglycinamide formyltransferase [Lentisphaerae bacterium]|jgi:phosphoribosylglycinamide formyltransferase-1|nr:phosphoribosylglycinamide formyltransferase [Lentisphaerota bacterium]
MEAKRKTRLAVLGSGAGTNMQSIQDAIADGTLDAEIVCVISDVSSAKILERATSAGIDATFIDAAPFKTKLDGEAEQKYIDKLLSHDVEYVVLAGFMRMLKDKFLSHFERRVINIHPSLLPAFPGLRAWKQALDYGVKIAGCTVHFVDAGMDTGPVILQKSVPVKEDDTPDLLHARIQVQEHAAYPEALRLLISGRLTREGRVVKSGV